MATKLSEEQIAQERVADAEEALQSLERQLDEARDASRRADEALRQNDQEQQEISAAAFSGNEEAMTRFRELEDEIFSTTRERKLAEAAVGRISAKLGPAKERLLEARIDAHKADYDRKSKEVEELSARRKEAAEALVEALGDERSALMDLSRIARSYDQDLANSIFTSTPWRKYLKSKLGSWL